MTQEIRSFFTLSENIKILRSFQKKLKALDNTDSNLAIFVDDLVTIIQFMLNDGQFFDEACQTNIEWIGQAFINEMQGFNDKKNSASKTEDNLDISIKSIFTSAYRFLCEAEFCSPNGLNPDLNRIKLHVDQQIDLFNDNDKHKLIYANYIMPANIARRLINHPNFKEIQSYNEKYANAEKLKSDWNDEISKKESAVLTLKDKLEEYKTGFNFVGLYKGFNDLSTDKIKEKNWALGFLIGLGILALTPVSIEIYLFLFKTELFKQNASILIYSIFPVVTIQVILIYFFRVALFNFKSIKAQLLQIELRKTLCQFIQSYAGYAKEIKEYDKGSLEKFENLIFSGLIANEENLPSTFDGLEQIGKLAQSIRGS
jgi:hypothetical protein